jgi:SAM-dependent methyltransferase
MGDKWFEIANLDHFWIMRRFEVLTRLADGLIRQSSALAEVGCGHGLLQRQIEDHYGRQVTGFDLNEIALRQTASRTSSVCCYNLFQQNPEYKGRFDLIFLFDVLEHLENEDAFVKAIQFHLAPRGRILINVPALQILYSNYDKAAGHFRRYNIAALRRVAERNGMKIGAMSYWGMSMTPLLLLRRLWLLTMQSQEKIISTGFDTRGPLMNRLLLLWSQMEPIPQKLLGSSLMAVLERPE